VLELINSGKLDNPKGLKKFLESMQKEAATGAHGKREELREALTRAREGHDVSLGGRKFAVGDQKSGNADVIDFTEGESLQMKVVSSADDRALGSNVDKALKQLRGNHKEQPPVGTKRIAKAIIENPDNSLYAADRAAILENLRTYLQQVDPAEAITVRVQNSVNSYDFESSELVP
jgi:hypothetical protein